MCSSSSCLTSPPYLYPTPLPLQTAVSGMARDFFFSLSLCSHYLHPITSVTPPTLPAPHPSSVPPPPVLTLPSLPPLTPPRPDRCRPHRGPLALGGRLQHSSRGALGDLPLEASASLAHIRALVGQGGQGGMGAAAAMEGCSSWTDCSGANMEVNTDLATLLDLRWEGGRHIWTSEWGRGRHIWTSGGGGGVTSGHQVGGGRHIWTSEWGGGRHIWTSGGRGGITSGHQSGGGGRHTWTSGVRVPVCEGGGASDLE